MANALEGHKRQALIFLPGLFLWLWPGTGSGSFGGWRAGRMCLHPLQSQRKIKRELLAARSSQKRAAAQRGSNCHFPADICFGLLRPGSAGLLLGCEAAAQGMALQQL